VDQRRPHVLGHFGEAPAFGQRDARRPGLLCLRRIVAPAGIQQREFCDPVCRLADDFQCDVSAHRKAGERKARRRGVQNAPRDRRHRLVACVVGDRHRPEAPKCWHLPRVQARRAIQTRHQDDGKTFSHENTPLLRFTTEN
jgi:hypothetical protein